MAGALEDIRDIGRRTEAWGEQCSSHLSYIERRLMSENLLAHELMRHFMSTLREWRPLVDLSWGCRTLEDWAQKGVRVLMKVYKTNEETILTTAEKAFVCVRVILEEAVHRILISCGDDEVKKSGMCALMSTLRNIEAVKARDAVELAGVCRSV